MQKHSVPERHIAVLERILSGDSIGQVAKDLDIQRSRVHVIFNQTCRRVAPEAYQELLSQSEGKTVPQDVLRKHKGLFLGKRSFRDSSKRAVPDIQDASPDVLASRQESRISLTDFRANLRSFLDVAQCGSGRVIVLSHSRPVFKLVPLDELAATFRDLAPRIVANDLRVRIAEVMDCVAGGETLIVCHYDTPIAALVAGTN